MYICTPENIQNPKVTEEKFDNLDYVQNLKIIHGKKQTKKQNHQLNRLGGIVIHMTES